MFIQYLVIGILILVDYNEHYNQIPSMKDDHFYLLFFFLSIVIAIFHMYYTAGFYEFYQDYKKKNSKKSDETNENSKIKIESDNIDKKDTIPFYFFIISNFFFTIIIMSSYFLATRIIDISFFLDLMIIFNIINFSTLVFILSSGFYFNSCKIYAIWKILTFSSFFAIIIVSCYKFNKLKSYMMIIEIIYIVFQIILLTISFTLFKEEPLIFTIIFNYIMITPTAAIGYLILIVLCLFGGICG